MSGIEGTIFEFIQYSILVIAILTIYFEVKHIVIKRNKIEVWWSIPTILWMCNGIIFYSMIVLYRVLNLPNPTDLLFTKWSILLRFQGYATLLILSIGRFFLVKGV